MKKLKVWTDDEDWIIAESLDDVISVQCELTGETESCYRDNYSTEFSPMKDDEVISVGDENGQNPVKATAAEWVKSNGRGMLASRNF